ncbi:GDSL esterase/lipase EXL3-like [Rosa rugosa]|uniref:GDSL esterase/lipase EXL3-like n=1 Tax=Rosa rugosa TaxID=74645 RepID=UPI002B41750D|nr:GDSL esterase/lipase EXL3-like [Rosa rugosa]
MGDFMGGKPTGRFSNGRVPSDFIGEGFGLKEILPAYLDPNLQLQDLLTGVCFASAGSGYDPLTTKSQSVLSLSDQLNLFKEYKSKITAVVRNERTATLLSKSLFVLSIGSNDLALNYFSTPLRSAHYDIPAYTDFLLELASNFFQVIFDKHQQFPHLFRELQELYALGERVIEVASMSPIGCVPAQRTLGGAIERACDETENQVAILFNSKLSALINSLNKRLPEAQLIYVDIYNPLLSIIQEPAQNVVDKGCCGTGTVEFGSLCNKDTPSTCNDASKYIFWDGLHPIETAYKILTYAILKQLS